MADNRRNRPEFSEDAFAPKSHESDPLAELARLIGQNDPFADPGRQIARKPPDAVRADDRPAPEWLSRPASAPDETEFDSHPAPRAEESPTRYRDEYRAEVASYQPGGGFPHPQAQAHDHDDEARDARAQEHAEDYPEDVADHDHAHASEDRDDRGDDRYRVALPSPEYDGDGYYAEDGHIPPHGEETYTPSRRRGGLMTIAAVIGLAVIGTAGAFAYRSYTTGSAGPANPPVIKADTTPAKIVPPTPITTASADTQGKPFQDRIGAPGAERVVPREEQPVSLPVPPRAGAQAPQTAFAPAGQGTLVPPPSSGPPVALNEPKRVRTTIIRQEAGGTDATATQQQPTGSANRAPAGKQSAAPLTIAPQSEPAAPRTKVATRTPPAQAAGGAYAVQVSAQRTEGEAQSSYRALQQKYPAVLGSREAAIRRVDLRDKGGIFYRAQVGSFANFEQATTFCNSLREAGGQCIVAKN